MSGRLASARRRRDDGALRRHVRGALAKEELEGLDPNVEVDALGTFCPEPIIRTQERMARMGAGEIMLLLADDVGVEIDIPAWCLSTGNQYLGLLKTETVYRVFVRRS